MKYSVISTYVNISLNLSYADVTRTSSNSISANLNSTTFIRITSLIITDTLYYIINTFRVANKNTNKTSAEVIRKTIKKEIQTLKN